MKRIKVITEVATGFSEAVNRELKELGNARIINVMHEENLRVAYIEYDGPEDKCLCCDCAHWDGGDIMGLCHACGTRKRFNAKACELYKDMRG